MQQKYPFLSPRPRFSAQKTGAAPRRCVRSGTEKGNGRRAEDNRTGISGTRRGNSAIYKRTVCAAERRAQPPTCFFRAGRRFRARGEPPPHFPRRRRRRETDKRPCGTPTAGRTCFPIKKERTGALITFFYNSSVPLFPPPTAMRGGNCKIFPFFLKFF